MFYTLDKFTFIVTRRPVFKFRVLELYRVLHWHVATQTEPDPGLWPDSLLFLPPAFSRTMKGLIHT